MAARHHPRRTHLGGEVGDRRTGTERDLEPVRGRHTHLRPVLGVAVQPLRLLARTDDHHLAGVHPVVAGVRQQHRIGHRRGTTGR